VCCSTRHELYQLELKPCCQPAIGEGASKNNGFDGVEEHWVVLLGVELPFITYLLAADIYSSPLL
jgi:hypothetical protein